MAASMQSLRRLVSVVESGLNASYGIEWRVSMNGGLELYEHYSPAMRVECLRNDRVKSAAWSAPRQGEAFLKKIFEEQEVKFVKGLQNMQHEDARYTSLSSSTQSELSLAEFGTEFGLHSAVFVPTSTGVFEVGSSQELDDVATLLPLEVIKAVREGSKLPAVAASARSISKSSSNSEQLVDSEGSAGLKDLVDRNPNVFYGIHWTLTEDGMLECSDSYSHSECSSSQDGLFTSRLAELRATLDEDLAGRVCKAQLPLFLASMQAITPEECHGPIAFARLFIAKEFDIHSAAFLPFHNGVLELGSKQVLGDFSELLPESSLVSDTTFRPGSMRFMPEMPCQTEVHA